MQIKSTQLMEYQPEYLRKYVKSRCTGTNLCKPLRYFRWFYIRNISNTHVSLNTVDIGLAQLAMHSPYETAGIKDTWYMTKAIKEFYETSIVVDENGNFQYSK